MLKQYLRDTWNIDCKVPMTKPKIIFQILIFIVQYIYILDNVLLSMPRFRGDYEDMWDQE